MSSEASQDTRNNILETTGRLFAKRGYFGISMQDIADELGISKAALYYHFKSKDELAQVLMRNAVDELKIELREAVGKTRVPTNALFNLVKAFLDFRIRHPEINLLRSLGLSSDKKLPIAQFVVDLQIELLRFLRELIGGIDFAQRMAYRTAFMLATSIVSFVLSPFQQSKNTKQMAADFTALIFTDPQGRAKSGDGSRNRLKSNEVLLVMQLTIGSLLVSDVQAQGGSITISQPQGFRITDVGTLVAGAIAVAFIVAGVIIFGFLVFGGILIITGGGDKTQTERGRNAVGGAALGFAIVATAWALMQLLEYFFGVDFTGVLSLPTFY